MDSRAQQAREHHRKSGATSRVAAQHREQRDTLIRALWRSQRSQWTYVRLAKAVGCSPELIAKIVRAR